MSGHYSSLVIQHFFSPHNVGRLDLNDPQVGTGELGAMGSTAWIRLQLRVDRQNKVECAKFKACGDPYLIAGASYLTTQLVDRPITIVERIHHRDLASALEIPQINLASAILLENVLRRAWDDVCTKR